MNSNGRPLPPPTTPEHTFAAGWNARCELLAFNDKETADWQDGWISADAVPARGRWPFNSSENFGRRAIGNG